MQKIDYELAELKQKFREYYKEHLRHKYEELEPIRRKYLWKFLGAMFLLVIGVYFFVFIEKNYKGYVFLALTVLFLFLAKIVYCYFVDEYKQETKGIIWNKILPFWSDFRKGDYRKLGITRNKIDDSLLFGNFNELHVDDCFCGFYKNVQVAIAELKLISDAEAVDAPFYVLTSILGCSKGIVSGFFSGLSCFFTRKEYVKYKKELFSGLLLHFGTFKKVASEIVVCEKVFDSSYVKTSGKSFFKLVLSFFVFVTYTLLFLVLKDDWTGDIFVKIILFAITYIPFFYYLLFYLFCLWKLSLTYHDDMGQVNLEDVVFSKKWKVYADDQVEARYVLTPALMERMLAVKKLFHGNRIDFSFWGKNLLIAVHTRKDMFETTSLFKSALDYKKVEEVICQMYSIFSVIDVLKLQNESKKGLSL